MMRTAGYERVMWPHVERLRLIFTTPAGQIRGGDRARAAMRAQIDAGAAQRCTPKRSRKLLVTTAMYSVPSTFRNGN